MHLWCFFGCHAGNYESTFQNRRFEYKLSAVYRFLLLDFRRLSGCEAKNRGKSIEMSMQTFEIPLSRVISHFHVGRRKNQRLLFLLLLRLFPSFVRFHLERMKEDKWCSWCTNNPITLSSTSFWQKRDRLQIYFKAHLIGSDFSRFRKLYNNCCCCFWSRAELKRTSVTWFKRKNKMSSAFKSLRWNAKNAFE